MAAAEGIGGATPHRFQYVLRRLEFQTPFGFSLVVLRGVCYVGQLRLGSVVTEKNRRLASPCGEATARDSEVHDQDLRPGDIIECVNGQRSENLIREELGQKLLVHMAVRRPPPGHVPEWEWKTTIEEGGQLMAMSNYDAEMELDGGYLNLKRGDLINVFAGTLQRGDKTNLFSQYVFGKMEPKLEYAESEIVQGWVPTDVLRVPASC